MSSMWCLPWLLSLCGIMGLRTGRHCKEAAAQSTASRRLARLPTPFTGEAVHCMGTSVDTAGPGLRARTRQDSKGKKNCSPGSHTVTDTHHTCAVQKY